MNVRINFPGGIFIEADTLVEAVAVAKAFAPNIMDEVKVPSEPAQRRTRVLTTNADLSVLDAWGIVDEASRKALSYEDWGVIARELNRSIDATQSLAQRYVWGVYESNGSSPVAKAIVHAERDRSRPGWSEPVQP